MPVLIAFPQAGARKDAWGTLVRLSARDAEISTLASLQVGEEIFLSFEIARERFGALAANVLRAKAEPDGYCRAAVEFSDAGAKKRIAELVFGLMAR